MNKQSGIETSICKAWVSPSEKGKEKEHCNTEQAARLLRCLHHIRVAFPFRLCPKIIFSRFLLMFMSLEEQAVLSVRSQLSPNVMLQSEKFVKRLLSHFTRFLTTFFK